MTGLLLASYGWIFDLAFFLILILGTALGAYRGFVTGICKLAGFFVSIIFAFTFCISFANFLENCFGMTTQIANGIAGAIAKNEAYAVGLQQDVAGAEIGEVLKAQPLNGIAIWLIMRSFGDVALIPAGTTPAMMLGSVLAKWISIAIAFVGLILIVRLGTWLIRLIFGAIKKSVAPIRAVDQVLGAILGLAKAAFLLFTVLLICNWLPFEGLHAMIESSTVVGSIFKSEWFQSATSYAVSGKWFGDYLKGFLFV